MSGDGVTIDLTQVAELAADLTRAGLLAGVKARTVVAKTAMDITADAQALAPVDTGNLKGSIGADIDADGMGATIGPTAAYGIWQEYGTSTQPGKPFLGPAFDRRMPGFLAAMGQIGASSITATRKGWTAAGGATSTSSTTGPGR